MYLLIITATNGIKFSKGYYSTKGQALHAKFMLRNHGYAAFEIIKVEDPDGLELEPLRKDTKIG